MRVFVVSADEIIPDPINHEVEYTHVTQRVFTTRDKAELWVFGAYHLDDESISKIGPQSDEVCNVFYSNEGDAIYIDEFELDGDPTFS